MIRSSGMAKAAAVTVAIIAHGALAVGLAATQATDIEGADTTADVRLGSSFKDLAAGTVQAQAATAQATPRAASERITAQRPGPAKAQKARISAPATPDGTLTATPARKPARAVTAAQRLQATKPDTPAVTRSLRPKTRSAAFEEAHKERPAPDPKRQTPRTQDRPKAAPDKQGNANRDARAGAATGQAKAPAPQSGSNGQKSTGSAAASNYPGLVMRKLSRVGKPRINARGAAVVAFSIGGNGRLSSVSLAQSSGAASLDRAALRLVRRAAPFPKPPRGAQRSFSIQIKGR